MQVSIRKKKTGGREKEKKPKADADQKDNHINDYMKKGISQSTKANPEKRGPGEGPYPNREGSKAGKDKRDGTAQYCKHYRHPGDERPLYAHRGDYWRVQKGERYPGARGQVPLAPQRRD